MQIISKNECRYMDMKTLIISITISLLTLSAWGQNNMGTPYSKLGVGLLPDNHGAYTGMGGVSAAMRDNGSLSTATPKALCHPGAIQCRRDRRSDCLTAQFSVCTEAKEVCLPRYPLKNHEIIFKISLC